MGGSSSQHSKSQTRGDKKYLQGGAENTRSASTFSNSAQNMKKGTKIEGIDRYLNRQAMLEA